MMRFVEESSQKLGLKPGSVVHVGAEGRGKVKIDVISYDGDSLDTFAVESVAELSEKLDEKRIHWVNLDGIHDTVLLEKLGETYHIHSLLLEDITNAGHRPKVEEIQPSILFILKMLSWNEKRERIDSEQISIVLQGNKVFSFQENPEDVLGPVRHRISHSIGRIRRVGADYLAYALMDAIVDHYFLVLEKLGERVESLQNEAVASPTKNTLEEIYLLKGELLFFRKAVRPLREMLTTLEKAEFAQIDDSTYKYLRDLYDHSVHLLDTIELYREMVTEMLNVYLSSLSNRMNAEMKVLTIVATIFIPLTFIAGIYGMNFKNMPELDASWGYPLVLLIMVVVAIGMLLLFRKKNWF